MPPFLCIVCHAAPGLGDGAIARRLNPPSPHLWSKGREQPGAQSVREGPGPERIGRHRVGEPL